MNSIIQYVLQMFGLVKVEYHWMEFYSEHIFSYNNQPKHEHGNGMCNSQPCSWESGDERWTSDYIGVGRLAKTGKGIRE
jgi:hypothetical protein